MRIDNNTQSQSTTQQHSAMEAMRKLVNEREPKLQTLKQHLETTNNQVKEERDKMKILMNCLEIARRIIAGDKVPTKDHNYLREHDPELYARSITLRFPKKKPREYKQLVYDEESKDDLQVGTIDNNKMLEAISKGENMTQEDSGSIVDVKI